MLSVTVCLFTESVCRIVFWYYDLSTHFCLLMIYLFFLLFLNLQKRSCGRRACHQVRLSTSFFCLSFLIFILAIIRSFYCKSKLMNLFALCVVLPVTPIIHCSLIVCPCISFHYFCYAAFWRMQCAVPSVPSPRLILSSTQICPR